MRRPLDQKRQMLSAHLCGSASMLRFRYPSFSARSIASRLCEGMRATGMLKLK